MDYLQTIMKVYKSIFSETNKMGNLLPTELYNETWMLRLVLYWFAKDENKGKTFEDIPISMITDSQWFSEGRLGTVFKDEKYTHADGIYGNILIGDNGYSDVKLAPGCKQFVVTESKMFSQFSRRITRHSDYNQAARNIVCMCHIAKNVIYEIDDIAFYTLLPQSQIDGEPTFSEFTDKAHINKTVLGRIEKHKDDSIEHKKLSAWYERDFTPFCDKLKVELISWEKIIETVCSNDPNYGKMLEDYYDNCKMYNQRAKSKSTSKQMFENEDIHGRGVRLIHCSELFPSTCVHFSWRGSNCKIREYISENEMSSYSNYSTEEIISKNPKVLKEYRNTERANVANKKWWYSEIQKYNKELNLR
ncbi:MAG: hypothetical protein FWD38_11960 [Oscillospiraceae bacterium]|nr:hypothetical protein [Oscillospiraceae bacterium]